MKNTPRNSSIGINILSMFKTDMKPKKGEQPAKPFTMRGVYCRLAVIAALSVTDLLAQAFWVVSSRNVGWDPWWLGVLDINSDRFDVLGLLVSIAGLIVAPGFAFLLVSFFLSHVRWVFLTGMAMIIEGISHMLGTGLGRIILYAQIVQGKTTNDGFVDGYTGITHLSESDTIYGAWPVAVAAATFALIALTMALLPETAKASGSKMTLGVAVASAAGLLGILIVELGFMPTRLILAVIAIFLAFLLLPDEVACSRDCEQRGVSSKWQWHAASLIWLETLLIFTMTVVAALGI